MIEFSPYRATYHWKGISFQCYEDTAEVITLMISDDEFEESFPGVPPTIQCAEAILDSEIHYIECDVWREGDERLRADRLRGEFL